MCGDTLGSGRGNEGCKYLQYERERERERERHVSKRTVHASHIYMIRDTDKDFHLQVFNFLIEPTAKIT